MPSVLVGRTIRGAQPVGGQVEILFDGARLLLSDGASPRLIPAGAMLPAKHQLALFFSGGAVLVCTVRMYGGFFALRDGEEDTPYTKAARSAPSPLTGAFDFNRFDRLWQAQKPSLSAKAFLATGQRIPGLGNGVLQDILFHVGVHPQSAIGALSPDEERRLFESVREILARMAAEGGRDTEKDTPAATGPFSRTKPFHLPARAASAD